MFFFSLFNTKQYLEYEDIRDVILAIGSCAGFWDVCASRLSWHVHKFASSLRPVARGMFVCCFSSVIAVSLQRFGRALRDIPKDGCEVDYSIVKASDKWILLFLVVSSLYIEN